MAKHNIDKTGKSRILGNLAITLMSLIIVVTLSEIILSLFGFGNLVIYEPDLKLIWRPLPDQNCYTKFDHKPVLINSFGTRGEDFNFNKGRNVLRILSLGDSRTFGWGLSGSETYSGLLEGLLQERFGGSTKVEVINAGVNGWSYAQMYTYLKDTGIHYAPDIVILADANEWTQFSEESSSEFIEQMLRRVWLKNILRKSALYHFVIEVKLKQYYEKYRTMFIPVDSSDDRFFEDEQRNNPRQLFRQQITDIFELIKENHINGLLVYIPQEDKLISSEKTLMLQIKEEIHEELDVPLIDLTKDFSGSSRSLYLPGDTVHPNADGNRIIAERLSDSVADLMVE